MPKGTYEDSITNFAGLTRSQATQASPEAKRAFKYPFVACELFCCEIEGVLTTLLEDDKLMDKLFSILDLPTPLDCVLAGLSLAIYLTECLAESSKGS